MRRIGALMGIAENDPDSQARIAALLQEMQDLGWTDGRNVHIDVRWGAGDTAAYAQGRSRIGRTNAGCNPGQCRPEHGRAATGDPHGADRVRECHRSGRRRLRREPRRPGGNATGFTLFEYGLSGKWLELLKQIAPGVTRVAVLRDSATSSGIGQFAVIQAMAPSFGVELRPIDLRDAGEIERAITAFARSPNGGLIVTAA